jgi:hypothetical protein
VIDGVNVVYVRSTARIPEPIGFAKQAGFEGGQVETHSWVLEVACEDFDAIVKRLREAEVPSLTAEPLEPQPGHRQFIVQDPMGFTIEVYCAAEGA